MRGRSHAFLLLLSSFQIFCSFVLLFFSFLCASLMFGVLFVSFPGNRRVCSRSRFFLGLDGGRGGASSSNIKSSFVQKRAKFFPLKKRRQSSSFTRQTTLRPRSGGGKSVVLKKECRRKRE